MAGRGDRAAAGRILDLGCGHYAHDPKTFDGLVFPTRRRVHLHDDAGHADQSFAPSTLDVEHVTVR